jgi:hypothetical protein
LRTVDSREEKDIIGRFLQCLKKLLSKDIALFCHQRNQNPIRTAELFLMLNIGLHVFMFEREQFAESGIDAQIGDGVSHQQRHQYKKTEEQTAIIKNDPFKARYQNIQFHKDLLPPY